MARWKPVMLATAQALLRVCTCTTAKALDLSEAYQAALVQDATLRAARSTAAAGQEQLPQARAQLLPNISASASRNRNQLSSTTPDIFGRTNTSNYGYPSRNETLTVRQPLFRKYQLANLSQVQAQVDDANAVLDTEVQNLAIKVGAAYFEALLAQDQLALDLAQQAAYRIQLDAARKTFAAGSGTRTDIDEAQARLDMAIAHELEAWQNVAYTRRQLQVLVNQPIDTLAALDTQRLQLAAPEPDSVDYWTARAEQHSPEIRVLQARVEVARLEVDKAAAGHLPTLDVVAQWSRSASENILTVTSRYTSRSFGLQLNVPLYAGGSVDSSVRQALAAKDRAQEVLEAGRRDLGRARAQRVSGG